MKVYEFIDFIQRKVNSLLFRCIIILNLVVILSLEENEFKTYVYVISVLMYVVLYFLLFNYSRLRLLNDFLLIGVILFGKDPTKVLHFVFLILPIINSINFSGQKKSPLLYILTIVLFFVLSAYHSQNIEQLYRIPIFSPLVSIFFLWIINYYTSLRVKIKNFRDELSSEIDNFYLKKDGIKRPYKIYKLLIDVIHKNIKKDLIEDIFCLNVARVPNERVVIINGSSFIWRFSIGRENLISQIREAKTLINEPISVEGKKKFYNLFLYTKVENQEYIYVFITKMNIPLYYVIIGFLEH